MKCFSHRAAPAFLLCCLALLLGGCDATDPQDDEGLVLRLLEVDTEPPAHVSILFKVDDATGVPVPNLPEAAFTIYEDNDSISVYEAERRILPRESTFSYSVVLLLDASGSIVRSGSLPALKQAAKDFVQSALGTSGKEVEIGVWWFDGEPELHLLSDFSNDSLRIASGFNALHDGSSMDNSTNLYGAVVEGTALLEQRVSDQKKSGIHAVGSLVVFTDGTDRAGRVSRSAAVDAVREAGEDFTFFTIGLGGEIDPAALQQIGRDAAVVSTSVGDLIGKFREVATLIRQEANSYYLLQYCSPKRRGEHTLRIQATVGDRHGFLREEFDADGFTGGCRIN